MTSARCVYIKARTPWDVYRRKHATGGENEVHYKVSCSNILCAPVVRNWYVSVCCGLRALVPIDPIATS